MYQRVGPSVNFGGSNFWGWSKGDQNYLYCPRGGKIISWGQEGGRIVFFCLCVCVSIPYNFLIKKAIVQEKFRFPTLKWKISGPPSSQWKKLVPLSLPQKILTNSLINRRSPLPSLCGPKHFQFESCYSSQILTVLTKCDINEKRRRHRLYYRWF